MDENEVPEIFQDMKGWETSLEIVKKREVADPETYLHKFVDFICGFSI